MIISVFFFLGLFYNKFKERWKEKKKRYLFSTQYLLKLITMIIILFKKKIKSFSQDSYNNLIYSINISHLSCPDCNTKGIFHHHGSYTRCVNIYEDPIEINVFRVKCIRCKTTHALLMYPMIPFSKKLHFYIAPFNSAIMSLSKIYRHYIFTHVKPSGFCGCFFFHHT